MQYPQIFPAEALPLDQERLASPEFAEWLLRSPVHSKLIPHVSHLLEERSLVLPGDMAENLRQQRVASLMHVMRLKAENDCLMAALHQAGIRCIPLKGAVLAEKLYSSLDQRPFGDIDLMVEPESLASAAKILLDSGYEDVSSNLKQFHLEFQKTLSSGRVIPVELHQRPLGYAIGDDHLVFGLAGSRGFNDWIWSRAQPGEVHWDMHPADELVYLCLHLAKHIILESRLYVDGVACSSLLLARDINLVVGQWGSDLDWGSFFATVERFHLTQPVRMSLALTRTWFNDERTELDGFVAAFPAWRAKYYFDWASNPWKSPPWRIPGPHQLEMVFDTMMMADHWSDRLLILPLVVGELFRRKGTGRVSHG